jgi:hypothetical protein
VEELKRTNVIDKDQIRAMAEKYLRESVQPIDGTAAKNATRDGNDARP